MRQSLIIGVDFDGTVVDHQFFKVGKEVPHAVRILKLLQANGHRIMLWTMRSHEQPHILDDGTISEDTTVLQAAINWFEERGITLWGVNKNPDQHWSTSNKQYCNFYIDDAAVGCPLIYPAGGYKVSEVDHNTPHERPYVNWLMVERFFIRHGIIQKVKRNYKVKEVLPRTHQR